MTGGHDPVFQSQMFQLVWLKQRIFSHLVHLTVALTHVSSLHSGAQLTYVSSFTNLKIMKSPPSRQRGSKELWLNAAYELLIAEGIDAVKIMPLAKVLNLSRTGFYWFFEDIAELHSALVQRWESKNTGHLIQQCNLEASNICEALFNLMDCWLDPTLFDAPFDLAIRNWARVDTDLEQRIQDADRRRISAVTRMYERHAFSKEQAEVRGLTVIYTQIGYFSMQVTENSAERLARVQHYVELFAGVSPSQKDIDAFLSRHATS
ncbi:TetR/AcrR family transcriptional regulator [Sulfitobacter sp.]|uniref:TetR/AcrR family transcriptional regulator n=1 Tax=Sulfitobacter sp. TaxID=1903071 RepID=UPI003296B895